VSDFANERELTQAARDRLDEWLYVACDEEDVPQVVCTDHPQIPDTGYSGLTGVGDDVRDRLNDALWDYCERVAERIQQKVDEFYASATADEP